MTWPISRVSSVNVKPLALNTLLPKPSIHWNGETISGMETKIGLAYKYSL